uniref:I23M n=1 Tax=Aedes albopictus TaxID=7160 RepID=Q5MIY8_AEDAL|nr:i23M [Aedes albopictus]
MQKQTVLLIVVLSITLLLIVGTDAESEYCPRIARLDCSGGPCKCVTDRDSRGIRPEGFQFDSTRKKCVVDMVLA